MGAYDRVLDRLDRVVELAFPLDVALVGVGDVRRERTAAVVHGGQRSEERLQGRTQLLVGSLLIGEERVATTRRNDDCVEDRSERRPLDERDVGVPRQSVVR